MIKLKNNTMKIIPAILAGLTLGTIIELMIYDSMFN